MIKGNKEEIVRILKYVFSSGTSFVLDLLLFTIFQWIFSNINLAIYNFILCKKKRCKTKNRLLHNLWNRIHSDYSVILYILYERFKCICRIIYAARKIQ